MYNDNKIEVAYLNRKIADIYIKDKEMHNYNRIQMREYQAEAKKERSDFIDNSPLKKATREDYKIWLAKFLLSGGEPTEICTECMPLDDWFVATNS